MNKVGNKVKGMMARWSEDMIKEVISHYDIWQNFRVSEPRCYSALMLKKMGNYDEYRKHLGKLKASPKVNTAPKRVNTAPKRVNTAPKRVNTAPKRVNTAPKRVNTADKKSLKKIAKFENEIEKLKEKMIRRNSKENFKSLRKNSIKIELENIFKDIHKISKEYISIWKVAEMCSIHFRGNSKSRIAKKENQKGWDWLQVKGKKTKRVQVKISSAKKLRWVFKSKDSDFDIIHLLEYDKKSNTIKEVYYGTVAKLKDNNRFSYDAYNDNYAILDTEILRGLNNTKLKKAKIKFKV